jgi:hypothetical protein
MFVTFSVQIAETDRYYYQHGNMQQVLPENVGMTVSHTQP